MDGVFNFEYNGSENISEQGKVDFDHTLYIHVPKKEIGELIRQLVNSLEEGKYCHLCMCGRLSRDLEQDSGNPII